MKYTRPDGIDPAARSRARRRALQAIYAWQMSGQPITQVIEQFRNEQDMGIADLEYFEALVLGVEQHRAELDTELRAFIDREIGQVDPIERAVLRVAAFEMLHRLDVPYRVVINEAIETTKRFGADHGHTFINGVLDTAAGKWRAAEVAEARRR
jgi:N utilization substance protein B